MATFNDGISDTALPTGVVTTDVLIVSSRFDIVLAVEASLTKESHDG